MFFSRWSSGDSSCRPRSEFLDRVTLEVPENQNARNELDGATSSLNAVYDFAVILCSLVCLWTMRNAMFPLSLSNYGSNELRNGRTSSEPDRSICYPGLLPSSLACNSIQFRSSVAPHSPSHPTHCWPTVSKCYYPEATGEGKMATGGPYVKMEGAVGRRKWEYETASSISKKRSATLEKDGKLADSRKKRSPGVNHPGTPSTDPRQTKPPVRKSQKLGDKVNALQQLVSPFGKTDTASVLQETTVYIKRLQEQIQVLSMPYFSYRPFPVRGGDDDKLMDLRSRGLCLVPVSTTTTNIENQETEIASRLGGLTALPHV